MKKPTQRDLIRDDFARLQRKQRALNRLEKILLSNQDPSVRKANLAIGGGLVLVAVAHLIDYLIYRGPNNKLVGLSLIVAFVWILVILNLKSTTPWTQVIKKMRSSGVEFEQSNPYHAIIDDSDIGRSHVVDWLKHEQELLAQQIQEAQRLVDLVGKN